MSLAVRFIRVFCYCALILAALGGAPATLAQAPVSSGPAPAAPAHELAAPAGPHVPSGAAVCAPDIVRPNGSTYRVCLPAAPYTWTSHDLIVFAHGYMASVVPTGTIPEDQLHLSGIYSPDIAAVLGYAFATTSYPVNGLAVLEAVPDLKDLVSYFRGLHPETRNVYLLGVSEGGLITALSVEGYGGVYSGGLAICGPVGDFIRQGDYFTDFRVLFDYFFPGKMPGTPIDPTVVTTTTWESQYKPMLTTLMLDPANTNTISRTQLFNVAHAPFVAADPHTYVTSTIDALWYNTFATPDAKLKLGGSPYDNSTRQYVGSLNDVALNQYLDTHNLRFHADPAAVAEVNARYQTTGDLLAPVVTLHTTLDQQVPYFHEDLYAAKVLAMGRTALFDRFVVARYGHCNVNAGEIRAALDRLKQIAAIPRPRLYLPLLQE